MSAQTAAQCLLKERSKYYKESKEGVAEMCKIMEDMREESSRLTRLSDIKKLMANLKLDAEEAMKVLEISSEEQLYYKSMLIKA